MSATILVVEVPDIQALIRTVLERSGRNYRVIEAEFEQARRMLATQSHGIDLVITTQPRRLTAACDKVPMIYLADPPDSGLLWTGASIVEVVQKPFAIEVLLTSVRNLTEGARTRAPRAQADLRAARSPAPANIAELAVLRSWSHGLWKEMLRLRSELVRECGRATRLRNRALEIWRDGEWAR